MPLSCSFNRKSFLEFTISKPCLQQGRPCDIYLVKSSIIVHDSSEAFMHVPFWACLWEMPLLGVAFPLSPPPILPHVCRKFRGSNLNSFLRKQPAFFCLRQTFISNIILLRGLGLLSYSEVQKKQTGPEELCCSLSCPLQEIKLGLIESRFFFLAFKFVKTWPVWKKKCQTFGRVGKH